MTVTVLDLRLPVADRPMRLTNRVVVIDDTRTLQSHSGTYVDLCSDPMVGNLVCVAVGDAAADDPLDGVALTVPNALRETTVLWVGDRHGVRWAPPATPTEGDHPGDGLDDLLAALRVEEVFDQVAGPDEEWTRAVASPAVRLTAGPADPADLAEAGAAAVQALCVARTAASRELVAAAARIDAEHDPGRPNLAGHLAVAGDDARRRLHRVADLQRELGGWRMLAGRDRPSALIGNATVRAGEAAEQYRRVLGEALSRMDAHLQDGRTPVERVVELGVADPPPARYAEIAAGLHRLVTERLRGGVALPLLAQELRAAAAFGRPQGVGRLHTQVGQFGPLGLPAPPMRWWPAGLALLPVIVLGGAALTVFGPAGRTGLWMAGGLGLLWWLAGWFLLARRPGRDGERGFRSSTAGAATHLVCTPAGILVGFAVRAYRPGLPRVAHPWLLLAGLVALAVLLCALTWRRAVARWRASIPLAALREAVAALDQACEQACLGEWQPMRRRRAIAATAEVVAGACESMARALDSAGGHLFPAARHRRTGTAAPVVRARAQDLYAVVHADLAALCEAALNPLWVAAAAGRHTDDGDAAARFKQAVDGYSADVARDGLMGSPAATGDPGPRDALARVLAESPAVRDTVRISPRDEMTQLCAGRQLTYLSSAAEPSLVRFAPRQLRRALGPGGPPEGRGDTVVWTEHGEYAGALRLVPLRPESVRGEY